MCTEAALARLVSNLFFEHNPSAQYTLKQSRGVQISRINAIKYEPFKKLSLHILLNPSPDRRFVPLIDTNRSLDPFKFVYLLRKYISDIPNESSMAQTKNKANAPIDVESIVNFIFEQSTKRYFEKTSKIPF